MPTTFVTMDGATLTFRGHRRHAPATPDVTATCQVISAALVAAPQTESTPATLCGAATTRINGVDYSLAVTYFQDWTDPDGFSQWLFDNAMADQAFLLTLTNGGSMTGTVQVVPGDYGGAAGSSLQATSSLPARDVVNTPATVVAAADAEQLEPV